MTKQPAASADLGRLDSFIGVWHTEGLMKANPSGLPVKFKASDSYEWLPGGHFLLHRFDADMPQGNIKGIEVIGYDKVTRSYPMHSFDSQGNAVVMQGRVDEDVWRFDGETTRFTGRFRDGGKVFAGTWELRSEDGSTWQPWMDVTLTRS